LDKVSHRHYLFILFPYEIDKGVSSTLLILYEDEIEDRISRGRRVCEEHKHAAKNN